MGTQNSYRSLIALGALLMSCQTKTVKQPLADSVSVLNQKQFACTSLGNYERCRGKLPSYSEPINIIFKNSERPAKNLALHLHGFYEKSRFVWDEFNKDYGFENLLEASGVPYVLVIPESLGRCDAYRRELLGPEKFSQFLTELFAVLDEADLTDMQTLFSTRISGHSGAYSTMASWVPREAQQSPIYQDFLKKLRAIAYFDATYGSVDQIALWAQTMDANQRLFYCPYVPNTSTARGVEEIKTQLLQGSYHDVNDSFLVHTVPYGIYFQGDSKTTHMKILAKHFTDYLKY